MKKLSSGEFLLRNHPYANQATTDEFKKLVVESSLHCIDFLVDKSKCKQLKVVLPPSSIEDLGLILEFDALCMACQH